MQISIPSLPYKSTWCSCIFSYTCRLYNILICVIELKLANLALFYFFRTISSITLISTKDWLWLLSVFNGSNVSFELVISQSFSTFLGFTSLVGVTVPLSVILSTNNSGSGSKQRCFDDASLLHFLHVLAGFWYIHLVLLFIQKIFSNATLFFQYSILIIELIPPKTLWILGLNDTFEALE